MDLKRDMLAALRTTRYIVTEDGGREEINVLFQGTSSPKIDVLKCHVPFANPCEKLVLSLNIKTHETRNVSTSSKLTVLTPRAQIR